jgi:hypothetical protein
MPSSQEDIQSYLVPLQNSGSVDEDDEDDVDDEAPVAASAGSKTRRIDSISTTADGGKIPLRVSLKAHKKAIRRAAVNTFGYIAKATGPSTKRQPAAVYPGYDGEMALVVTEDLKKQANMPPALFVFEVNFIRI